MRKPPTVKVYKCVSHSCILWEGRELTADEYQAFQKVHALQHRTLNVFLRDILGDQEKQ